MMANSWKTIDQICDDYNIKKKTFYAWSIICKRYPEYRDAIIQPTGQRTFVDEENGKGSSASCRKNTASAS